MVAVDRINIAGMIENSTVNGPGHRCVLWVQGCLRRCPGCLNVDMQPLIIRHVAALDTLAAQLCAIPEIEGVTFTGGEPMLQARQLAILAHLLRAHGLSIMTYTGYPLADIRNTELPGADALLAVTDILVDGPFLQEQAAPLLWRGSHNQHVHFLTDRYAEWADRINRRHAVVEFSIGPDRMITTGIWPTSLVDNVELQLRGEQ